MAVFKGVPERQSDAAAGPGDILQSLSETTAAIPQEAWYVAAVAVCIFAYGIVHERRRGVSRHDRSRGGIYAAHMLHHDGGESDGGGCD